MSTADIEAQRKARAEQEKREHDYRLARLRELVRRAPADYSRWGHKRTLEYKAVARSASAIAAKHSPAPASVRDALKAMEVFYTATTTTN